MEAAVLSLLEHRGGALRKFHQALVFFLDVIKCVTPPPPKDLFCCVAHLCYSSLNTSVIRVFNCFLSTGLNLSLRPTHNSSDTCIVFQHFFTALKEVGTVYNSVLLISRIKLEMRFLTSQIF